jgi:hypothetical protein
MNPKDKKKMKKNMKKAAYDPNVPGGMKPEPYHLPKPVKKRSRGK